MIAWQHTSLKSLFFCREECKLVVFAHFSCTFW